MKPDQIAAQLYTVRDFCRTAPELAAALEKIRAIGYPAVQVSGIGPLPAPELARILADHGLVCCATHEPPAQLLAEPQAVVERLQVLGCRHTAYPYPAGIDFGTATGLADLVARLNATGQVLHAAGLVLSYHNHSIEFRRVDGRLVLEEIYTRTDPRYLQAEIDTYWVQHGGGDPVAWCRRLQQRLATLHLKDYGVTDQAQPTYCEVGAGNLDWRAIIAAADAAGCEWYIVEQDTCPGDPFESLARSYAYVREQLCAAEQ